MARDECKTICRLRGHSVHSTVSTTNTTVRKALALMADGADYLDASLCVPVGKAVKDEDMVQAVEVAHCSLPVEQEGALIHLVVG